MPSSPARRRRTTRRIVAVVLAGAAVLAMLVPTGLARQQAAPTNSAQPTITGTPSLGQTLTAAAGTWTGSPTFAYQWVRCPTSGGAPDGSDCAVIGGASTTAYIIASADVGSRLRVRVTASNAEGSTVAASNATSTISGQAGPPNTARPTIAGSAVVGQTLVAAPGTWTGPGITYAYAWSQCDASGGACAVIRGATQTTYKLVSGDAGKTIRVAVTGTDTTGSNTATSPQTAVVTQPAPITGCPAGSGPIDVDRLTQPARLQVSKQRISPTPVTRDTKTIRVSFQVTACGGRPVEGALVYATPTPYQQFSATEQPTSADGWAILTMSRLRFFPASNQQQLLVVFVRARKQGEDLLGGISSRRLVSFPVRLSG